VPALAVKLITATTAININKLRVIFLSSLLSAFDSILLVESHARAAMHKPAVSTANMNPLHLTAIICLAFVIVIANVRVRR
jgi:hypothetical protein